VDQQLHLLANDRSYSISQSLFELPRYLLERHGFPDKLLPNFAVIKLLVEEAIA
jgi:hypothetical protein